MEEVQPQKTQKAQNQEKPFTPASSGQADTKGSEWTRIEEGVSGKIRMSKFE
jgi:hypothetical protein